MVSNNSNNSSDSDQSQEPPLSSSSSNSTPTVIPPTTIVFLPSMVSVPNSMTQHPIGSIQTTYINSVPSNATSLASHQSQSQHIYNKSIQRPAQIQLPQQATVQMAQQAGQLPLSQTTNHQRAAIVASSSSLPYLSLSTNQPLRAVAGTISSQLQQNPPKHPKIPGKGGRGSRSNSNRPPPGAVNLERSYQICQAVIQNSPNRHQLKAQLRPPPSMLSTTPSSNSSSNSSSPTITTVKRDDSVSSSNRPVYKVVRLFCYF